MKFLFKLITKARKISKILGYIYTGMLAASSALETLVNTLPEDKARKFRKALKYITAGSGALKEILGWFGMDDSIEDLERDAEGLTLAAFQDELAAEFKENN